jgi:hypothetical protein
VRPVEDSRDDKERQRLGAGPVDILGARLGDLRALRHDPLRGAAVDWEHAVPSCLDIPHRDHLDQLVAVLVGQVVVLRHE